MKTFMKCFAVLALLACGLVSVATSFRDAAPVHALVAEHIRTYTGTPSAETTIITGATGTSLHVRSIDIGVVSTAGVWIFRNGTGGTVLLDVYVAANTGTDLTKVLGNRGLVCTQNTLTLTPPSAATVALNARTTDE